MSFNLFIIESLHDADKKDNLFEGKYIRTYLDLIKKDNEYHYIDSERGLKRLATAIKNSNYENIFISCHGDKTSLELGGDIEFEQFAEIFNGVLNNRRVFFSVCSIGNRNLAKALFSTNHDLISFVAPIKKVFFASTYVFWTSFFYMLSWRNKINDYIIKDALNICSSIFCMDMYYCATNQEDENYYDRERLNNKKFEGENLELLNNIIKDIRKCMSRELKK